MRNEARFEHLHPLFHSVNDILHGVLACTVTGEGCVLRHVTKWVIGRIGTTLTLV